MTFILFQIEKWLAVLYTNINGRDTAPNLRLAWRCRPWQRRGVVVAIAILPFADTANNFAAAAAAAATITPTPCDPDRIQYHQGYKYASVIGIDGHL